ncbi:hypothetical protein KDJ21_007160 [Metabacillus litoralis]|uniref:hypothetical protein n=1 Tax=Metabacillus litoralis TaxID=152268 RepID=UPI0013CEA40B|nr:hypothetical protein [Metabacillus litoralis]UHA61428.1 hypothetical protein KDJ21_007160 [Metabacillus litoralis]
MNLPKLMLLPLILSMIVACNVFIEMAISVRRGLIVLTLGSILWFIYEQLKEPVVSVQLVIVIFVFSTFAFLLVVWTLFETGW